MKIAVLVYGRLHKCLEHYSNITETIGLENQIDFFLSSDNDAELNDFINVYKPISYTNEKITYNCDLSIYPNKQAVTNIHNMTCHFINKMRVYKLLEEYKHDYDIVLSLRIDLVIHTKIKFNKPEDNTIYVPDCYDYGGLNDQMAYGNFISMGKYMNIFKNVIYLLDSKKSPPHPESLTLANIVLNDLKLFRFKLAYFIER